MLQQHERVPGVRKIAVLRANGIGDLLFALPALEALRAAYPSAEIVLLGKAWHAKFFSGRPGPVDRAIVVPPYPGVSEPENGESNPAELAVFFAAMAEEQFDLAIQIHGGGAHSNPFLLRLGARVTAGLVSPDAPRLDRWVPYIYYQQEIFRFLEAVALVGAMPVMLEPRITVTEADLNEALPLIPEPTRPLAVLHPGAGDPRRHWPAEKFALVGDVLAEAGAQIMVIGTEPERALTEAVVDSMTTTRVQNLCGRLSLGGLAGLLSRCAVVVSNDSGPLHLAGAVGASTVGIYWAGNLINAGPVTRSRHRAVISWQVNCPICDRHCGQPKCDHQASFVTGAPVAKVIAHALDLFFGYLRDPSHCWPESQAGHVLGALQPVSSQVSEYE